MTPTDEEVEAAAFAELLFAVDQPKSKWADYNKPGWHVYERYMKMGRAAAARVRAGNVQKEPTR